MIALLNVHIQECVVRFWQCHNGSRFAVAFLSEYGKVAGLGVRLR